MRFIRAFRVRPVYLLVVERVLSNISLEEIEEIGKGIDKIVKKRDDIVSQLYRTMFFLASTLILIFLIEINLVAIPSTVWGVRITIDNPPSATEPQQEVNNQDMFIFGFLLIGNVVALLFSSAMVKAFILEFVLKTYCWLKFDGPSRYISELTYRFYVFVFGLISEQDRAGVPKLITRISGGIHWVTVLVLPLTFIFVYCLVLLRALIRFWTEDPTGIKLLGANVELWYFSILVFFNVLTLSFYVFAFFPCPVSVVSQQHLQALINQRANDLWERAGKPTGKYKEIERIAERQVKLGLHVHE
jgi:hypothetical protein